MLKIKKISDFNFKFKKVLVRLDLNVPTDNKKVTDDSRIKASIPTIKEIIKRGGTPLIASHFGRPKGKSVKKYSLKIVSKSLSKHLGQKVLFSKNCIGKNVQELINDCDSGQTILLENLRFHKEEQLNDTKFAKQLSQYADIYINDAFSVSHRKHASIDKITKFLPSGIGKNMENEILNLNKYLYKPKKPVIALIGGSKMETKIGAIKNLIKYCNCLVLGGGIANTFLKSRKINIGKSIWEKNQISIAKKIEKKALENNCKIILPIDVVVSDNSKNKDVNDVKKNEKIYDIGENSLKIILKKIDTSKTIIWSGPLGFFEKKPYDKSSNQLSRHINSKKKIICVAGGGDTLSAIKKSGQYENFSFLSTGGGAFLKWLEKFSLPGIEILKKN